MLLVYFHLPITTFFVSTLAHNKNKSISSGFSLALVFLFLNWRCYNLLRILQKSWLCSLHSSEADREVWTAWLAYATQSGALETQISKSGAKLPTWSTGESFYPSLCFSFFLCPVIVLASIHSWLSC